MGFGPFQQYVEPGAYVRTLTDPSLVSIPTGIRIPVYVGVADEEISVVDLDMFRGSSAFTDNLVTDEDLSDQIDPLILSSEFQLANFPIVTGEGSGQGTNDPRHVSATINGSKVPVTLLDGILGRIRLGQIPIEGDIVKVTYHFNRTDTLIEDEDVSAQADGVAIRFFVANRPIVRGDNGGTATTEVRHITVKVNSVEVIPSVLNGRDGYFELSASPAALDTVEVTYFTNLFQNTFDFLPNEGVTEVLRVGLVPGRQDFIEGTDFKVIDNRIFWGGSAFVQAGEVIAGSNPFDEDFVQITLIDNQRIFEEIGTGDASNKDFTTEFPIVDGGGTGKITNDLALVQVFVGATLGAALSSTAVEVAKIDGTTRAINLKDAPGAGDKVFITYFYSLLAFSGYDIDVTAVGDSPVGKFKVRSDDVSPQVMSIVQGNNVVADVDFASEGILFPGGNSDLQTIPGFSVEETITLTFTSPTEFTVTSDNAAGSGTGLTTTGSLGQTFIDDVTGVRFTIEPGTTVTYASSDTLEFLVTEEYDVSSEPFLSILGLRVTIQTTDLTDIDNTARVETFQGRGNEPLISEAYYITYKFEKVDFTTQIHTQFSAVARNFGDLRAGNDLVLAAFLGLNNGAPAVGLKQVLKDPNTDKAAPAAFINALEELGKPLLRRFNADVLVPLTTDSFVFASYKSHVERLSSIRFRSERLAMFGVAIGETQDGVINEARGLNSDRVQIMYPDGAIMPLVDELGQQFEIPLDGSFIAAAYAGVDTASRFDVAEPMTRKQITGFRRLVRVLDEVEMNQLTVHGVTVIKDQDPQLIVRHAITTRIDNVISREPSIRKIIDHTQLAVRSALERFIGQKNLPRKLIDIEEALASVYKILKRQEIIVDFTGIAAELDEVDPTIILVESFFSPVFPINWIVVTQNLRGRL